MRFIISTLSVLLLVVPSWAQDDLSCSIDYADSQNNPNFCVACALAGAAEDSNIAALLPNDVKKADYNPKVETKNESSVTVQ